MHPLFLLVGVWYACFGDLFVFFCGCVVALQHELAHAFAASKLGYKLNAVILMPFGAILDGDLQSISLKDEIFVAICGPICNLFTALLFVALWWFAPTMYAFTDVAFYASMAIALINLLPAYPLDGGRIFKCLLLRFFRKKFLQQGVAEQKARLVCRLISLSFSALFLVVFILQCIQKSPNITVLLFGVFLFVGALGNRDKIAVYSRMDFYNKQLLQRGMEIRRIAILDSCPIKNVFRFLSNDSFLVLEVYDENERHLFTLSQNQLSALFAAADTPYDTIGALFREKHALLC